MTRPIRRDKNVKNASVIAGLRMEPKLAVALTARALHGFARDKDGLADVAEVTRHLLRAMLNISTDSRDRLASAKVPGLRLDETTLARIEKEQTRLGLTRAGTIRHLLRLALEYSEAYSFGIEENFAAIAEARRALAESYAAVKEA